MIQLDVKRREAVNAFTDIANVYLTSQCDMGCKFCYASKGLGETPLENLISTLNSLKDAGAMRVNITGGEALMNKNALSVVKYAHDLGLAVSFFTSGLMYNQDDRVSKFSPYITWLALSLDGAEAINLKMGRRIGHFESVLAVLRKTKQDWPQVKVRVATVVTSTNIDDLGPLAQILAQPEVRPSLWRLKQMVPTRLAGKKEDKLGVSDTDFYSKALAVKEEFGDRINIQVHGNKDKLGDSLCIHPDGAATVTLDGGEGMDIVDLGNIFETPDAVFSKWNERKIEKNSSEYVGLWSEN